MEAVAEAVMDMQAILLGNKTNVDKLEMWNIKGQYVNSLKSCVSAFILSSCFSRQKRRTEIVHLTVKLCG